jgi:hypothetical protein
MDISDLTIDQLKRAAAIREQIDKLNEELGSILGAPAKSRAAPKKTQTMSAAVKRKIAATQKARWVKIRQAKSAMGSTHPALTAKKKTFSRATRAKLSRKLKAYWAAKKAGKK